MAKMYTKSSPLGETYLYNEDGKLLGRGRTDSAGTTRFTGQNGTYIGRCDPGLLGGRKMFGADGSFAGTAADRFGMEHDDIATFDCDDYD